MNERSNIMFDANFAVNKFRGMGKYINNLVSVIEECTGEKSLGLLKNKTYIPSKSFYSFGSSIYPLWEQVSLPIKLRSYKGIMIFPYNTAPLFLKKSSKNILIIHDLIYLHDFKSSSLKQKLGALYRRILVPRVAQSFEKILTVSEYSKLQIIQNFGIDSDRISVIPNSVDFANMNTQTNLKFESRSNYFLHIGGEPVYKNSKAVLYSFSYLSEQIKDHYRLKIIGIRDSGVLAEYKSLCIQLDIIENVDFLEYQTDEQISELYQNAKIFIFPSIEEGFGIPILEAFMFGCPLACSNSSCLPEIAEDGAWYFDPNNYLQLTDTIHSILNNEHERNRKVNLGYLRVAEYSHKKFQNKVSDWFKSNFE